MPQCFEMIIVNGKNFNLYKHIAQNGKIVQAISKIIGNSLQIPCPIPFYNSLETHVSYHKVCFKSHSNLLHQQRDSTFKFTC